MKRILIIPLLIFYSIASFGISVNNFYCCGQLKKVSTLSENTEKNCQSAFKKDCCENKLEIKSLKVANKASESEQYLYKLPFPSALTFINQFIISSFSYKNDLNFLYKKPSPEYLPSRQILFCVFTI